jgi:hypothetical protein
MPLNKATFSMVSRLSLFAKCRVVSTPVKITVSVLSVIVASAYAEKRRADERTRTAFLLITSARSEVAEGCTGLHIPHR